jgi:limonene-1,2-epoxide hydrolase
MTMNFLSPAQTVRLFLTAMETLNYREAVKYVADDCDYTTPPPLSTYYDLTSSKHAAESHRALADEREFKTVQDSPHSALVFVESVDRQPRAGEWVNMPVTGVFKVRDGLITFWHDYANAPGSVSKAA